VPGPLYLADLGELASTDDQRRYSDEAFSPVYVPPLRDADEFFGILREQDVLLHHPYESFEAVVDFVTQAAEDPNVVAIKQTLYRTGGESPLVRALQRAAELGKQVTALVELKARFDEESNIRWARALERSGVNVMYGLVGLKLHAKVLMVVRKSPNGLERFVHLATGNYNQQTARLYEDLSLFTSRAEIAEDATALFNLLTGYSTPEQWNHFIVAPLGLHEAVQGLIRREAEHARAGRPAGIVAKMNSLVDADSVRNLYEASQAGVRIDLLIRGICCLRPGIPGVSENIQVHAVIDRFLEHARLFRFENGGQAEVYCSSADWMPRNFRRRIEVMFPILDKRLRKRVTAILETMRSDNQQAWDLRPDGRYVRRNPDGEEPVRSQSVFMEMARERARESPAITDSAGNPLSLPSRAPGAKKRKKRKPKAH
jgi:polyphosphate kinase